MIDIDVVYNEDCVVGMQKLPDNSIDLIVTSPPYNIGVKYDIFDDFRPWSEYYAWCKQWLTECYRVLKPDGRFCLNHYFSCGTSETRSAPLLNLHCICTEIGFKHHGLAVWGDITLTKYQAWGSWLSASAPYVNSPYEAILIQYKDHWKKDRKGVTQITPKEFMESCSGVWKLPTEKNRSGCPAPFPIALASRCIRLLSYEGDIVLEPFMGSGTTPVAAKQNKRYYIGYEISKAYFDQSTSRLSQKNMSDWTEQPESDLPTG